MYESRNSNPQIGGKLVQAVRNSEMSYQDISYHE